MRMLLTCTILFSVTISSLMNAQDIRWEKSFGGRNADYLFDAVPTADYGFLLAGGSLSEKSGNKTEVGRGDLDYCLWKMNEKGEPEWQKSFGGSGNDMLKSVVATADGGYLLAGSSDSPKGLDKKEDSRGKGDFWIIKLDAGGAEQWQRTIGGNMAEDLVRAIPVAGGGYLVGGTSYSGHSGDKQAGSRGNADYWIVKLSAKGDTEWQKTYGGSRQDILRDMAPTTDGGMVVAGYSNSPDGGDKTEKNNGAGDFWILKLDKAGNLQWQRTLGGSRDDEPFAIRQTFDGNFIVGGTSNSSSSFNKIVSAENGSDIWLVKIDQDGQNLWQQDYDYGRQDMLMTICENPDHTLLLGGFAKNNPGGGNGEGINDYIAIKTDEKGELLWRRFVGSDGEDVLRKLIVTRDGGYVLAGTSNPEEKSIAPRRKKKGSVGTFGIRQVNNAAVDDLNQQLDAAVQDQVKSVNGLYKRDAQQAIDSATRQVSDATDSRLKIGGQAGDILSAQNKGGLPENNSSAIQQGGPKPGLTASRQKKTNFGGNDFWIVKLKDKDKPEKAPAMVEAFPNPAYDYTNVVVGYEYTKGWATLYDLSGHQLQHFKITGERTIPINLGSLPEGIYLVQIGTDKGNDTVKIIKGLSKN